MPSHRRFDIVAMALAGLAILVATTGSAVAVSVTRVKIADPKHPKQVARVDASGRLLTTTSPNSIQTTGLFQNMAGDNFLTAPTQATLAITKLNLTNPTANAGAVAEVRIYVYAVSSTSATTCTPDIYRQVAIYNVAPGDDIEDNLSSPLVVKPAGSKPYCIDLYAQTLGGTYSGSLLPAYTFAAYVKDGSYKGLGKLATPAGRHPARLERRH